MKSIWMINIKCQTLDKMCWLLQKREYKRIVCKDDNTVILVANKTIKQFKEYNVVYFSIIYFVCVTV